MSSSSPAILALILLIVIIFVVVIVLAYNPAPAITSPVHERTAQEILESRRRLQKTRSSLSPNREGLDTPSSQSSVTSDIYEVLRNMRNNTSLNKESK